ncbi:hypothetical protein F5Y05DRAFT_382406 [Hypoxylon sp. FL0543]|nr:hypothetical protein F5Y05DRAFT_382406 [Hypoxylon sp. FL0543]
MWTSPGFVLLLLVYGTFWSDQFARPGERDAIGHYSSQLSATSSMPMCFACTCWLVGMVDHLTLPYVCVCSSGAPESEEKAFLVDTLPADVCQLQQFGWKSTCCSFAQSF